MKVLVSGGWSAGWATWNDNQKAVAEYQPIIEYVESGKPILSGKPRPYIPTDAWETTSFDEREAHLHPDFRALVKQMMDELGMSYFYTGGAEGLSVEEVEGPYCIEDYDGNESLRTSEDFWT